MQDVFVEQIVRRKRGLADVVKIVLVILAALALMGTFLIVNMLRLVFPFIFAFSIYCAYMFIRFTSKEYEYGIISDELDVTEIAGRKKRKVLIKRLPLRRITILAPADEKYRGEYQSDSIKKVVDACISPNSDGLWFFRFEDEQGLENAVFFNPNDRVLRAMAKAAPRAVRDLPDRLTEEEN